MKHIKTMAVEITEATYPLAVACLPDTFVTLPFDDVVGHFLVINDFETIGSPSIPGYRRVSSPYRAADNPVRLTNVWMPADLFDEEYKYVGPGRRSAFLNEVTKKSQLDSSSENSTFCPPAASTGYRGRLGWPLSVVSEHPDLDEQEA